MALVQRVIVISATRESDFAATPLGVSLKRLARDPRLTVSAATSNREGLPAVYNPAIDIASEGDVVVFAHDDLWIEDYFFADRVLEALKAFDVVGLAGNTRRVPGQTTWSRVPGGSSLDLPHLRGAMAHGDGPMGKIGFFGPIIGAVESLDGVFIAAKAERLQSAGVRFDERFSFHLYDLDFCRTARAAGLKLGTFALAATHRSTGNFGSDMWRAAAVDYLAKWREPHPEAV